MSDDHYDAVREALPEVLPPLTSHEASRAVKRLWKHFAKRDHSGRVRRCWISTRPTNRRGKRQRILNDQVFYVGPMRGWARLIHDVSHGIFARTYPDRRPHDPLHSHYETEVAKYVVEKGWLEGKLRPRPPKNREPKAKPTSADKLAAVEASIKRWQTKAKRAATALKKLERRRRGLMRATAAA